MSAYYLRSSQNSDDEVTELNNILKPIEDNIMATNMALEEIRKLYEAKFLKQQYEVDLLQTKVQALEEKVQYHEHSSNLHARKIDDLEQVSRKINLRLKGILVNRNDSPEMILQQIYEEIESCDVIIPREEIDRVHRVGRKYMFNSKLQQDVLIKFRTWRSRNIMYQNRKKFSFLVQADLTTRREDLFSFAKGECQPKSSRNVESMAMDRVVEFVFCDINCKIKFKSKTNKFYSFSSEIEFLNLVDRLDNELCYGDDIKKDINNRSNYASIFYEEKTLNEIFY